MNFSYFFSRFILGLTFLFSGFVKGIDLWGINYKFIDYFNAWGLEFLIPFAMVLSVILSGTEIIIGISLVFNAFMSVISVITFLFMIFFTSITFLILKTNPVSDCGCFGEALILTNQETFLKNIILLVFAFILLIYHRKFTPEKTSKKSIIIVIFSLCFFFFIMEYSFIHLPIIDFRPFKTGTNIPQAMLIPKNAKKAEYKNVFVYKNLKTGKEKKFSEENYPWKDSINWTFVSMKSKLVHKGYEPKILNFNIMTKDGEDVKDFFLYDNKPTFFLILKDIKSADFSGAKKINKLSQFAKNNNMNFIALTAAPDEDIKRIINKYHFTFIFFNTDQIVLKTMIRSNPGLIFLKKGTILKKWSKNDIPTEEELKIMYLKKAS